MNKITKEAITALVTKEPAGPAVTIYSPTHTAVTSPHMSEDQIYLKNLVTKAIDELQDHPDGNGVARKLGDMLDELLADQPFWEHLTEGLLICADKHRVQLFYLPMDTEEYVAVSDCFHLAPVLGILHDEQAFYVLSVTQQHPRLYAADMYGLTAVDAALPSTVEQALNIDEQPEKMVGRDPHIEDRLQFFRLVDHAVTQATDRTLPLVLAGVESETAEYRMLSKYPKILHGSIKGSTKTIRPDTLFHEAKAIVYTEIVMPRHQQTMETYDRLVGTDQGRVAQQNDQISTAADQGRIATLLMGMSRLTRDTIQDSTQPAERITFPRGSMADAFNAIARAVQNTSGSIMMVNQDALPKGQAMAAILRY